MHTGGHGWKNSKSKVQNSGKFQASNRGTPKDLTGDRRGSGGPKRLMVDGLLLMAGNLPNHTALEHLLWPTHQKHTKIGWRCPPTSARRSTSKSGTCTHVMASQSPSWPPPALLYNAGRTCWIYISA